MQPVFLTLDEVLALHDDQIQRYGGAAGIRDERLLSSALGAVSATFEGRYLHADLFELAAAYLYYLAQNHPFVDGNKRTALAACLAFLWMNGMEVVASEDEIVDTLVAVASGRLGKSETAVFLKSHAVSR